MIGGGGGPYYDDTTILVGPTYGRGGYGLQRFGDSFHFHSIPSFPRGPFYCLRVAVLVVIVIVIVGAIIVWLTSDDCYDDDDEDCD